MTQDKMLTVLVSEEKRADVRAKSKETGVPYSEVLRRAIDAWLITGELPIVPAAGKPTKSKGVKRSKAQK